MTRLQCLDVGVSITASPARLGEDFAALYGACERDEKRRLPEVELAFRGCERGHALSVDGVTRTVYSCTRELFLGASIEIDRACVAACTDSHLMIHASCAARESRAVLVVGPSSAGKSTLAAALALAGFDYVGDEVIGIPAGTSEVCGYAKPFKLDGAARQLLADAFARPDIRSEQLAEDLVAATAFGATARTGTNVRPTLVVVPGFAAGEPVAVEPLTRPDVAELLADQCFNFAAWGARGLRTVADVARGCEGVRLRAGDLDAAVTTIDRLLS